MITLKVSFPHTTPEGKEVKPGDTYRVEDEAYANAKVRDGHVTIETPRERSAGSK